jgi:hypothetical protein
MKQPDPKKSFAEQKAKLSVTASTKGWDPAPLSSKMRKKAMKDRAGAAKYGTITGPTTAYVQKGTTGQISATPIESRRGNPYNINTVEKGSWATPDLDKQAIRQRNKSMRGRDPKFGPAPKK